MLHGKKNQADDALQLLNEVKDKSSVAEEWETFVEASIELAKLHANFSRGNKSANHLKEVREVLRLHSLDPYYQLLYEIRMTSWHQFYGNTDSVSYYATKALPVLDEYDRPDLKASWFTLQAAANRNIDDKLSIQYYQEAAKIYKEINDHINLAYIYRRISQIYMFNLIREEAKVYNDSALSACYQAIMDGHERIFVLHEVYKDRGLIFKVAGIYDSAYDYTRRGLIQEMDFYKEREGERVAEIEEQYQNKQKSEQIEFQAQRIKFQQQRLLVLSVFIGAILLLIIGLIYYSFRLRKANRLAGQQATIIKDTNQKLTESLERQLVLQGEIHHRVKNNLQVIISLLELQQEDIQDESTRKKPGSDVGAHI